MKRRELIERGVATGALVASGAWSLLEARPAAAALPEPKRPHSSDPNVHFRFKGEVVRLLPIGEPGRFRIVSYMEGSPPPDWTDMRMLGQLERVDEITVLQLPPVSPDRFLRLGWSYAGPSRHDFYLEEPVRVTAHWVECRMGAGWSYLELRPGIRREVDLPWECGGPHWQVNYGKQLDDAQYHAWRKGLLLGRMEEGMWRSDWPLEWRR
jgi:hypothetical protein